MRLMARGVTPLLIVLLAACGGAEEVAGPVGDPSGVYTLRTVDGQPLPFIYAQIGNDTIEFLDGTVHLNADKTFIDATTVRITAAGVVTIELDQADGVWSLAGPTVTFTQSDLAVYNMRWDGGDILTQIVDGLTLIYRK